MGLLRSTAAAVAVGVLAPTPVALLAGRLRRIAVVGLRLEAVRILDLHSVRDSHVCDLTSEDGACCGTDGSRHQESHYEPKVAHLRTSVVKNSPLSALELHRKVWINHIQISSIRQWVVPSNKKARPPCVWRGGRAWFARHCGRASAVRVGARGG
jgi:hypothetical protein